MGTFCLVEFGGDGHVREHSDWWWLTAIRDVLFKCIQNKTSVKWVLKYPCTFLFAFCLCIPMLAGAGAGHKTGGTSGGRVCANCGLSRTFLVRSFH